VEKRSSGSVVKIDTKVGTNVKVYFSKFFVALKPCIDGFKEGSRPYLSREHTCNWPSAASPVPGALPPPPLSLLSHMASRRAAQELRLHHRCTPSCCGVSESRPKPSTSAISAGSGITGVVLIIVCV
jgi:hypothetical protein